MSGISCRSPMPTGSAARSRAGNATTGQLLLVDDSAFFRNMLAPVLRAAGYDVTTVGERPRKRFGLIRSGAPFDICRHRSATCRTWTASRSRARCAPTTRTAAYADHRAVVDDHARKPIARVRAAGFHDFVAKFDRQGLIAALKEQTADIQPGRMSVMNESRTIRTRHRIRHRDDRRPIVRPADRARAGRVRAGPADAGAARPRRDRRRAQSARPHRHRDRYAPPARRCRSATRGTSRWRSGSTATANPTAS